MDLVQQTGTTQAAHRSMVVEEDNGTGTSGCGLPCWERYNRWETPRRRREAGEEIHQLYLILAREAGVSANRGRIMEWGVNEGENAKQFAPGSSRYHGVDTRASNLDMCAWQLRGRGLDAFRPVYIKHHTPEAALLHLEQPVDLFLSTGAFQRFPDPDHGVEILRVAHLALRPGGAALIQIRYHDGSEYIPPPSVPSFRAPRRPCSYRVEEFRHMAQAAGFTPERVLVNPPSRSAFYLLRKESS